MIRRLVGGAAVAGIAIFGGAGVFDDDTTRNDQGDIVESGGVGVLSIQHGDCLQIPEEDVVVSLEGVPCNSPHDSQAYEAFDLVGYSSFPTEGEIEADAFEGCEAAFEGFVGTPFQESELYLSYLSPSAEGWDAGDHEIQCLIVPESGKISFDAEGSGR